MPDIMEIISRNLRNLIYDQNLTIVEFADRSNIPKATINNILYGKCAARIETLDQIRSSLGVSWKDLLGGND